MATQPKLTDDAPQDDFGVLLGWTHDQSSRGILLKMQSTNGAARERGDITARYYMMTNNQALILAKYLLDVTGQALPEKPRNGPLARLMRRFFGG
jgi:hypothetical protein